MRSLFAALLGLALAGCAGAPQDLDAVQLADRGPPRDRSRQGLTAPAPRLQGVPTIKGVGQIEGVVRGMFGGSRVAVSGTPTDGHVLTYSSSSGTWGAAAPAGGDVPTFQEVTDAGATTTNVPNAVGWTVGGTGADGVLLQSHSSSGGTLDVREAAVGNALTVPVRAQAFELGERSSGNEARIEVNSNVVTFRDGSDSADAPVQAASLTLPIDGDVNYGSTNNRIRGVSTTALDIYTGNTLRARVGGDDSGWNFGAQRVTFGAAANAPEVGLQGGEIALTDDTATTVARIALSSGGAMGGTLTVVCIATDGTDHQAVTEVIRWAAVNKAGTITASIDAADAEIVSALSTGTLTTAWTAVDAGGGNLDLQVQANTSLTPTSMTARVITATGGTYTLTVQ